METRQLGDYCCVEGKRKASPGREKRDHFRLQEEKKGLHHQGGGPEGRGYSGVPRQVEREEGGPAMPRRKEPTSIKKKKKRLGGEVPLIIKTVSKHYLRVKKKKGGTGSWGKKRKKKKGEGSAIKWKKKIPKRKRKMSR